MINEEPLAQKSPGDSGDFCDLGDTGLSSKESDRITKSNTPADLRNKVLDK